MTSPGFGKIKVGAVFLLAPLSKESWGKLWFRLNNFKI